MKDGTMNKITHNGFRSHAFRAPWFYLQSVRVTKAIEAREGTWSRAPALYMSVEHVC